MATVSGTSGNDNLNGTSGNDTLSGLGGNDTLVGSGGTDSYDGGTGIDTLNFSASSVGVTVSFASGTISGAFTGTFANMECVLGSNVADSITGAAGNQNLSARGGNDTLAGGAGVDTLWGGNGADSFVFREFGSGNADIISDFSSGADKIVLDASVMTALGANGPFSAGDARFAPNASGTAQDSTDRVIFNTTTRQLFYDADGNGSGTAVLIATLQSGASLAATDIVVDGGSGSTPAGATEGDDSLTGGAGNDSINGLGGNDTISGLGGDDIIDGGSGVDSMIGGTGADEYFVDNAADMIVEDQLGGMDIVYASVSYTLPAWVNHLTLAANGLLDGTGNEINNVITGNNAANTLSGGLQSDTLTGGGGSDRFLFDTAPSQNNADSITDFVSGGDKLVLDGAVMGALGASGNFATSDARFAANSTGTAQDASDRVIFNTSNRQVLYDADGNTPGGVAAVLIATLQSGATLDATDIVVVNGTAPGGGQTTGTSANDSLVGGPGNDSINGLGGNDTINGLAGDDTIEGGTGTDSMVGGLGDDQYFVDSASDVVVEEADGGFDTVNAGVTYTLPQFVNHLTLTGTASISGTGNEHNNVLTGNSAANTLIGLAGDDVIDGAAGADSLFGGDGADTLNGGTENDRLDGGAGHDWLTGGLGSDIFAFGAGALGTLNALLTDFQSGSDKLELDASWLGPLGLSGNFAVDDARFYSAAGATAAHDVSDRIIYNTSNGALYLDPDGAGSTWQPQLIATLQGAAPLAATDIVVVNGTAPSGATVSGTDGNDSLVGTWRDDQMEGLGGDDTMRADSGMDLVLGGAGNDSLFGEWGSDTLEGGAGNDWLEGGSDVDVLRGNDGDDTLDGGPGANFIYTGSGADRVLFTYRWSDGTASIQEFTAGLDELAIDRAVFTEIGAAGDFVAGDERFYAAAGATSGHDATDRLVYDTSTNRLYYDPDGSGGGAAQLIAAFSTAPSLTATDITVIDGNAPKHLIGTSGNDTLIGRGGDDTIEGLAGNDTIRGAGGNDSLLGGDGNDFIYTGAGSDTADGGAGDDWIYGAEFDDEPRAHRFTGGEGDDTLYGADGDDALSGGDGHDYIRGNGGADTLDGGLGNDTIVVDAAWDGDSWEPNTSAVIIDEGGIDTIIAVEQDWVLGDGFENLRVESYYDGGYYYYYGRAGDRVLIGNSLDNHIDGSDATSAQIQGLAGNDTLLGGFGSNSGLNVLDGGSGNDLLKGTAITDRLFGGTGDDSLEGSYGADVLDGGEGNDTLVGGPSSDWLPSGDLFRFGVTPGASNADRIVDFVSAEDTIEFVNTAHAGIGASGFFAADDERFHAAAGATSGAEADDRVIYDTSTGNLYYDADGSGSGAALLVAILQNAPTLVASDIIVTGGATSGTAGNDSIRGTPADDTIDGGAGDDTVAALAGNDIVLGGAGHDSLQGGDGSDQVLAGDGNDTLDGGLHVDTLDGGFGDDTYLVDDGDVLLDAGGVEHVIAEWSWTLGDGFENLTAGFGVGNALDNRLSGLANQNVTLSGHQGDDTLEAAGGWLSGGEGNDVIQVTSTSWSDLYGGDGNDSITGAGGNDWIRGNRGNDTMAGGAGSDNFVMYNNTSTEGPGYGQDRIDGGEGFDWLRFDGGLGRTTGIAVDLAAGTLSGAGASGDSATFASIEAVAGSEFNDSMWGSAAGNSLGGGVGVDLLDGRAGNDNLTGGTGADVFVFTAAPGAANADLILDFASGTDKLHLDAAAMPALGTSGAFTSGDERFHIGTAAPEADDRVVYNSANGQLFYDADGSGAGLAELIATLSGPRTLAATDIVVINSAPPPPPPPEGAVINGTGGRDTLSGTAGDDTINGFDDNDLFLAGSTGGNDVINGGAGLDSIEFKERATSAITVDFVAGTITGGSSGSISFTSVERILTGNFNDTLTGNGASQTLTGQGGSDTIWGAGGVDTLWGGTSADSFVFREMGTANADRIRDFASGSDKVHLDDAAFAAIGAMGNFNSADARFKANSSGTATDTNDRVVFNTSTGQLYYDADGSGSGAALQLIATVQAGATVAATDIVVI